MSRITTRTQVVARAILDMTHDRDGHGDETYRYSTWQEAEDGHKKALETIPCGFTKEELEASKAIIEGLIPVDGAEDNTGT